MLLEIGRRTLPRAFAALACAWTAACSEGPAAPPAQDAARPATVAVTPATTELSGLGATAQLTAQVRDQNGQVMAGAAVVWSSDNGLVATVNASGLVTAAHAPVLTTTNSANDLLRQTAAIRSMEGGAGYYMGLMALGDTTEAGRTLGLSSGPSMVSIPDARIMAHELGHSLSLLHPPGEAPPVDVTYPHTDRVTGSWGYDFRDDGTLVSPDTYDLMSYGRPGWIGDYHYGKALRFRRTSERATTARADTPRQSLLLWGGIDAGGELYLDPAFIVEASPKLPDSAGEYRLTGRSDGGGELFDVDFSISIPEDGGGQATFVFFLPCRVRLGGRTRLDLTVGAWWLRIGRRGKRPTDGHSARFHHRARAGLLPGLG